MEDQNFKFAGLTMAVILGVMLKDAPEILTTAGIFNIPPSHEAILLFIGFLIFMDMFINLHMYHVRIRVSYDPVLLFLDLTVGFLFVIFVHLIGISSETANKTAMGVGTITFILLFVRQIGILGTKGPRLKEKLKEADVEMRELWPPIIASIVGIITCVSVFLIEEPDASITANPATLLDGFALACVVAYIVFTRLLKLKINYEKRLLP